MTVQFELNVTELFDGEPPEPFGTMRVERLPEAGDTVMLKWLDGTEAYSVRVVRRNGFDMDVKR